MNSTTETMMNSTDTDFLQAIQNNYMWFLCSIGVPGNILAIIIILTMQSLTPATFLVAFLAFSDGSALVTKLLYRELYHKIVLTDFFCKLQFLPWAFPNLANWTLVFISVERFISVCYPLKKNYLVTLPRCYICVAVMSAVVFTYHMALIFSQLHLSVKGNKTECSTPEDSQYFWNNYFPVLSSTTVMFAPFLLIAIFTVIIIIKLKFYAKQRLRTFQASPNNSRNSNVNSINAHILHENERAERALTWMLIMTALLFLVLTFPACVYFLAYKYPQKPRFLLAQYILFDSSHALNFFMYFVAARRFRNRCFELICRGKCPRLIRRRSTNKASHDDVEDDNTPDTLITSDNL